MLCVLCCPLVQADVESPLDAGIGPFGKKRIFYPKTDPIAVYEGSVIDGKRHGKLMVVTNPFFECPTLYLFLWQGKGS
jgi:hypothetical protein